MVGRLNSEGVCWVVHTIKGLILNAHANLDIEDCASSERSINE